MNSVYPSKAAIEALAGNPSNAPVVMLNLLKFKRAGGSKAYTRYSDAFQEVLQRHGGPFVYLGASPKC